MNRNLNVDFLKVILSFFVIAAHVFPTYEIDGNRNFFFFQIQGLARLTVPLFFIITGFYIRSKISDFNYIKKITKRLAIIYIVWQLLYLNMILNFFENKVINLQDLISNLVYGIAHLWYLFATILAILLIYFSRNLKTNKKIILAFSLLILGYIFQYVYQLKIIESNSLFSKLYVIIGTSRNFLFYAFPYLLLGTCYDYWSKFTSKYWYFIFILFIGLFLESNYYRTINSSIFNIFLFPMPICLFLFDLIIKKEKEISIKSPLSLSLGIYLIHFYIVFKVFQKFTSNTIEAHFLKYLIVSLLSIFVWYIMDKINKKIPIFF